MASPGQKRGLCGHLMVGFDFHAYCACCRDNGKGTDSCVKNEDCQFYNDLTQEQRSRLTTPSYQKKKEKRDQKAIQEASSSTLVDPALCRYSTGADPTADPKTLGSATKVGGRGQKSTKKDRKIQGWLHLPDRTVHLQTGRGDYPDKT